MAKIEEGLEKLMKEYSELFNKYDFYVSKGIPQNFYKAIDIGSNTFIVFTERDIKERISELMEDFVKEQKEALKNGNSIININDNSLYGTGDMERH